jgi:hypothetical protein
VIPGWPTWDADQNLKLMLTSRNAARILHRFSDSWQAVSPQAKLPVTL